MGVGRLWKQTKSGVDKIEPHSVQPVLIFYQLSHGQDPDWILGDCVGIALPTFLLLILGI